MSSDVHVPDEIDHATKSPAVIAGLETVPVTAAPAAVTVAVPMVTGLVAQEASVPHSNNVIVGLPTQVKLIAYAMMLSTLEAFTNLPNTPLVLVTAVSRPGWKLIVCSAPEPLMPVTPVIVPPVITTALAF
jgi:hypothetical protein